MNGTGARLFLAAGLAAVLLLLVALSRISYHTPTATVRAENPFGTPDASIFIDEREKQPALIEKVRASAPFVFEKPAPILSETVYVPREQPVPQEKNQPYTLPPSYSYYPTTFSFPLGTQSGSNTSPVQKSLYAYGNALGSLLISLESTNTGAVAALEAFFSDERSADKRDALRSFAKNYRAFAVRLRALTPIPQGAAPAHEALAGTFQNMAAGFETIASAQEDEQMLKAIASYNAAADSYLKGVQTLALLFSVNEVQFSENDSGAMFVFRRSASF